MRRRDLVVGALAAVAAAAALAFLVLPVAAIFLRVPPGQLLDQLSSGVVTDALIVTADAVDDLKLQPGMAAAAVVKATLVMVEHS